MARGLGCRSSDCAGRDAPESGYRLDRDAGAALLRFRQYQQLASAVRPHCDHCDRRPEHRQHRPLAVVARHPRKIDQPAGRGKSQDHRSYGVFYRAAGGCRLEFYPQDQEFASPWRRRQRPGGQQRRIEQGHCGCRVGAGHRRRACSKYGQSGQRAGALGLHAGGAAG